MFGTHINQHAAQLPIITEEEVRAADNTKPQLPIIMEEEARALALPTQEARALALPIGNMEFKYQPDQLDKEILKCKTKKRRLSRKYEELKRKQQELGNQIVAVCEELTLTKQMLRRYKSLRTDSSESPQLSFQPRLGLQVPYAGGGSLSKLSMDWSFQPLDLPLSVFLECSVVLTLLLLPFPLCVHFPA